LTDERWSYAQGGKKRKSKIGRVLLLGKALVAGNAGGAKILRGRTSGGRQVVGGGGQATQMRKGIHWEMIRPTGHFT